MVQNVRARLDDDAQRVGVTLEIGDQHLDGGLGEAPADLTDALGEDLGAAVGQVVAVDAGDHDVLEPHLGDRLGEAHRLVRVERGGGPVGHGAVGAIPRADVAQDHERGGVVLPALPDVGAVGFLADGVKLQPAHHLLQGEVVGPARGFDLQPGGLALIPLGGAVNARGELNERGGHAERKIAAAWRAEKRKIQPFG